jgi:hypothetical protein
MEDALRREFSGILVEKASSFSCFCTFSFVKNTSGYLA